MNWRWKARIQNAVAALPVASNPIYYAIQRNFGGLRPGHNTPVDWFRAAIEMVDWAESAGQNVTGKRFLEVGTGRMVNVPTALWLCGAAQVMTVDLNPYLSAALISESHQYIRQHEEEILALFGARAKTPQFEQRFQQLVACPGDLPALLKLMNLDYRAPADATALPVPAGSFDFHISYTVLEHIPGAVISRILEEARRVLVPDGLLIHFVDPSDHFSHDDKSITAINFLQFSESEWGRWAGNQFMYHNRLRSREYLELFEQAGVKLLRQQQEIDEPSLHTLQNGFGLDTRYQNLPADELATTTVNLMGRFGDA